MNDTEIIAAIPGPPRVLGIDRRSLRRVVILLFGLLLAVRGGAELALMREHGPDPQMGIWWMFLAIKMLAWGLGGAIALALAAAAWRSRWLPVVGLAVFAAWAVAIAYASWQYDQGRQALAAAANPATSPERLAELVHFAGVQPGYELDNRLARNPHTPPEALRALAARVDQQGTQMLLARNPRTPADVLPKLQVSR
jgi:hypothetical protein